VESIVKDWNAWLFILCNVIIPYFHFFRSFFANTINEKEALLGGGLIGG
jgi:hypothetical protein